MIIGVPKEIKKQENRVGLVPSSVELLVKDGNEVYVETNAGINIGISDSDYTMVGAKILPTAAAIFEKSEMIIKVKEPQATEIAMFKPHHILYTYLHLAADKAQAEGLMKSKATCIAYETIEMPDHSLPLLAPMSQVAGRMSVNMAAYYLQKHLGGLGILPSGTPGTPRAKCMILGAGVAGQNALAVAVGMGFDVTIFDINIAKLSYLEDIYGSKIKTIYSNNYNIEALLGEVDVIIGTVLIPGAAAPKLIRKEHLKMMKKGVVMVDISIDQGGCFETSKATSHQDPIFEVDGIIHYCVANMPGAYARTSTYALNNATISYARLLAKNGLEKAIAMKPELLGGVNIYKGNLVHKVVAHELNIPCCELDFNSK